MEIYIKTHIVKKGETLESIVSKYNISDVEVLRYFHNQNAPKDRNHVGREIYAGQEIFIPSQSDIEKISAIRKEKEDERYISLKNNFLQPDISAVKQHYKVKITHSVQNGFKAKEQLEFDAHIEYCGKTEDSRPVLQYRKDNYLINSEKSGLKLYDLALFGTEFLYPVEFSLSTDKIFKPHEINNINELKTRWSKRKKELQLVYKDSYSSRYIQTMDEAMNDGFSKYFMTDFFIQFFFAPYSEFVCGRSAGERYFHSYRITYQDRMEMEILENTIEIEQKAYCTDPRTAQQILAKWRSEDNDFQEDIAQLVESDISATYQLSKKNKTLKNANATINTLFYDEGETIEIEIAVQP